MTNIIKMEKMDKSKLDESLREIKQSNFDAAWDEYLKNTIEMIYYRRRREEYEKINGENLVHVKEAINKSLGGELENIIVDKSILEFHKESWMNYKRADVLEDKKIEEGAKSYEKVKKAWAELMEIEGNDDAK